MGALRRVRVGLGGVAVAVAEQLHAVASPLPSGKRPAGDPTVSAPKASWTSCHSSKKC